jgi:hypothetical protein
MAIGSGRADRIGQPALEIPPSEVHFPRLVQQCCLVEQSLAVVLAPPLTLTFSLHALKKKPSKQHINTPQNEVHLHFSSLVFWLK